ncbi:type II secretion system protein N [Rubripirellula reticaptiva]|uniref:Type II secretion system protein GspC N-terminal domain-containing protein n=1 Tax=Rubripirellula reticaptiva TaxID=2528013 RepID=A0A5C6F9K3_9BACT|nr:type II secretion system protein N [Rubripirellula reticaptiva]TWU58095.1 hypothetical protein Poly59_10040 [Rubripirellula reticaptiva]
MDITNQRRTMNALAIMLLVGAGGVGYWAVSDVSETDGLGATKTMPSVIVTDEDATVKVPLSTDVALRSLRSPLYDPPAPTPRPVPVKPPPPPAVPRPVAVPKLGLILVGTIIDPNGSVAIISDAEGKFDIKAIGEELDLTPAGVTIDGIESERVMLSYQGSESTVRLQRSEPSANSNGGGNLRPNGRRRNQ